jgi:SEC-C motif-containing protein
MTNTGLACPCGGAEAYTNCCRILHRGETAAQTAEQLMRSRYSAYALKLIDYLVETTHPDKRPTGLRQAISDWAEQVEFYRLEIISTRQGQATDKIGKVEFIAHYRRQGKEERFRELSRFKRYARQWVYLDGEISS